MEKEFTSEELTYLNQEELKKLFLKVRSKILLEKSSKNKTDLEIYYCYIAREIERRGAN